MRYRKFFKTLFFIVIVSFLSACEDQSVENRIKEAVKARLKDFQSTQFRGILVNQNRACIEYNEKNGSGEYVGFKAAHLKRISAETWWFDWFENDRPCSVSDLTELQSIDREEEHTAQEILVLLKSQDLVKKNAKSLNDIENVKCRKMAQSLAWKAGNSVIEKNQTKNSEIRNEINKELVLLISSDGYCKGESRNLSADGTNQTAANKSSKNKWRYRSDTDKMSGNLNKYASIDANDILNFEFPYNGGVLAWVTVRQHVGAGVEVMLNISKGQFMCGVNHCSVLIRFDDKPAFIVSASQPSDYSSTVLFLDPVQKIVAEMKQAKVMHIQATFFREGTRVMTFDVEGLSWDLSGSTNKKRRNRG